MTIQHFANVLLRSQSQSVFAMRRLNWLTWELLGRSSITLANAVQSPT